VRDSRIVADEEATPRQDGGQMGQGSIRHSDEASPTSFGALLRKSLDHVMIGRTFDDEEGAIRSVERANELSESNDGPALVPATAPRMNRNEVKRLVARLDPKGPQEVLGRLVILFKERQAWRALTRSDLQGRERAQQIVRSMFATVLRRSAARDEQMRHSIAIPETFQRSTIGRVTMSEPGDDEVEATEIGREILRKLARESAVEADLLDRDHTVDRTAPFEQAVRRSEPGQLNPRIGKALGERNDRREHQHAVP